MSSRRRLAVLSFALLPALVGARCSPAEESVVKRVFAGPAGESEWRAIFQRVPSAAELDDAARASQTAARGGYVILKPSTTLADSFMETVRSSNNEIITLIGHNDGGAFRFSDGSAISLDGIGTLSRTSRVAVISCYSTNRVRGGGIGIGNIAVFAVAQDTATRFAQLVGGRSPRTLTNGQLQALLDQAFVAANRADRSGVPLAAVGLSLSGGMGITIYEVS